MGRVWDLDGSRPLMTSRPWISGPSSQGSAGSSTPPAATDPSTAPCPRPGAASEGPALPRSQRPSSPSRPQVRRRVAERAPQERNNLRPCSAAPRSHRRHRGATETNKEPSGWTRTWRDRPWRFSGTNRRIRSIEGHPCMAMQQLLPTPPQKKQGETQFQPFLREKKKKF